MKDKKKYIWIAAYTISTLLIIYGAVRLIIYFSESFQTENEAKDLADKVVIVNSDEESATDIKKSGEKTDADTEADTADTSEEKEKPKKEIVIPDAIDFDALLKENKDVVSWILGPDTSINYPVVQAEDNDYYLYRNIKGELNKAGTLFMDAANDSSFTNGNTLIYGHNMKSGAMFHDIVKYDDKEFYEEQPVMYLYTPAQNYELQLVVGCYIQDDDPWYQIDLSKEEREKELNRLFKKSTFQSGVKVGSDDKLVTLSTCTYAYENARYVLVGKLVKR